MNQTQSKQEAYAQLINSCKKSNLSVSDFCQQNDIRPSTFYYWQKKLRNNSMPKSKQYNHFVPVKIKSPDTQNNLITNHSSVSIKLPSDVTITFNGSDAFTHSIGRVVLSNIQIV